MLKKHLSVLLCIFILAAAFPYAGAQAAYTVDPATGVISDFDKSLSGKVIIPETDESGNKITEIAPYAFRGCDLITEIVIPETVMKIGGAAFSGCTALVSVTLPNTVTALPKYAFENCTALTAVNLENITLIDDAAFWGCTALKTVALPDLLEVIGVGAFYKSGLVSVTLPESVTSLGASAFDSCASLRTANLNGSFKTLGEDTFFGCVSLNLVSLAEGITAICPSAFEGCSSLRSVYIPPSAENIAEDAFKGCGNFAISGKSGSFAEKFAKEHGTEFRDCEGHSHMCYNWETDGESGESAVFAEGDCEICCTHVRLRAEGSDIISGDTDLDGTVNAKDAAAILKYDAQILPLSFLSAVRANVNFDDSVSTEDAIMILRYDAEIISRW